MAVTAKEVLTDPRFQAMSPTQKKIILSRIDPKFAALNDTQQDAVLAEFRPPPAPPTYGGEAVRALGRTAKGVGYDLPKAVLFPDNPLGVAGDAFRQLVGMLDAGAKAAESGESRPEQTLAMMRNAPLVGEMVRKAEEAGPPAPGKIGRFAPQTLGAATEALSLFEGPKVAAEALPPAYRAIKPKVGTLAQEAFGVGREPVLEERIRTRESNTAKLEAAQEKYAKEVERWKSGEEKSAAKAAEAKKEVQAEQEKLARKSRQEASEHVRKTEAKERARQEKAGAPAEKRGVARRITDEAENFQKNAKRAHYEIRKSLDARWNQFRGAMKDATIPKEETFQFVKKAQDMLQGSPENLTVFKNLMKEMGAVIDDHGEVTEWGGTGPEMPVDTARVHSSAIGEKLASGGLPGNVYQALKILKEGMEGQIETAADARGQGDTYRTLKRDWSTYMDDWRDSKSPLANVVRAQNPGAVEKIMVGNERQNLSALAAKYQGFGATRSGVGGLSPSSVTAAGRLTQQLGDLSALEKVSGARQGMMLQSESPRLAVERGQTPRIEKPTVEAPQVEATPRPEPPTVKLHSDDPAYIRRMKLLGLAGLPFKLWDIPTLGSRYLLKANPFLEFVAKHPRNELPLPEMSKTTVPVQLPDMPTISNVPQHQIWQNVVENLKMKLEREKAAGSSDQYQTRIKLLDAEENLSNALEARRKQLFGGAYESSPRTLSKEGGTQGGANYTQSELDKLKQKYPNSFQ